MAESTEQPSGFWTLTRSSKLSKRRNSDLHELHHKVFNVCVVGLSGVEKDKGPIGIGKSCLCNRFVRSAADDYFTDHISVLSQTDFGGRVVNNDHWLYWGSIIKSCDGYDLAFNVIEQTEFVDDSCFQTFKGSGKMEPYFKRCANTKLVSAEKLMYICKNQLGIEREYEQRYLPDGKFNVDGFLCLFDVSEVQGRNIDKQIEMTNLIMLNLMKARKPVVFVTTKHDEASELLVAEAERLVNQRDFRGLVPIVETSAQENVNISTAFLVCAQLIDKTRAKLRVPSYFEAQKNHQELLKATSEAYLNLIRSLVLDHRTSWQQVCIKLSHNPEFLQYTYLHGLDKATMVFKNHVNALRDSCINQKVQTYLKLFPDILNELVPNTSNNNIDIDASANHFPSDTSGPEAWLRAQEQIKSHPMFNEYFLQIPPDINWYDTKLLESSDLRIPSDWLNSEEAYSIFLQRNLYLESENKRRAAKEVFARLLPDLKIPVGQPFIEIKHMFSDHSNLAMLTDQELFEVYVDYQNNLLQQARTDFQELLLENAEHLHHLTLSDKVIRQEDIKTLNTILQHDERYQALDRFEQDRTLMMIRHLSFLHSQISEQCPSYPKCVEPEIERLLITKAKSLVSKYFEIKQGGKFSSGLSSQQKTCDLVIIGPRRPSQQLRLALNVLNSRSPKELQYQITFTVFENSDDIDSQIQKFRKSNTKPKGCFGIFTNRRSLEHVNFTLEKFLASTSNIQKDNSHSGTPPIVMLYAADITLDERTMLTLENDGQQMADRFKCPFMNVTAIDQYRQHQQNNILNNDQDSANQVMSECASLDYACVDAAFNVLKEAISRRVCFMELYNNQDLIPRQAFNPDARILMCLLCDEPFSNEHFMWKMFLDYEDCFVTSSKSICLKIKLDDGEDKFIEITVTSYTHGALSYREELLHGFILVCSIQRKASLSVLNAFSFNIPCTPVLVMAIKSDINTFKSHHQKSTNNQEDPDNLVSEAKTAARRLKGHFEYLDVSSDKTNQSMGISRINSFLYNVIKRKPIIEKAYELGDTESIQQQQQLQYHLQQQQQQQQQQHQPLNSSGYEAFSKIRNKANKLVTNNDKSFESRMQTQTNMSSSDNLNEDNGTLERNLSEDSEQYSSNFNSALSKNQINRLNMSNPEASELYAKRPLPPIPTVVSDRQDLDRDMEISTISSSAGNSKAEPAKIQYHLNDGTNESSSDDDTEGSTDNKLDKPKPGKLDLSQFDNITNAIGKLNIQPSTIKNSELNASGIHSKVPLSQLSQDSSSYEGGFFKNRSKKAKNNKIKEIHKQQDDTKDRSCNNGQLVNSFRFKERQRSDLTGSSGSFVSGFRSPESSRVVTSKSRDMLVQRKSSNELAEVKPVPSERGINDRSVSSKSDVKTVAKLSSTFLVRSNQNSPEPEAIREIIRPKPAIRATQATSSSNQHKQQQITPERVKSPSIPASISTNTPTSSLSTTPNVASGAKRIGNPRQNHSRAVAPPQLPLGCSVTGKLHVDSSGVDSASELNNKTPIIANQAIGNDDGAIDFSQSPIAQRLLMHSKDHKVSEINSPHESDCEQSQSMNLLRAHKKFLRGHSLGTDNNAPGNQYINSSIDSSELINSRGAAIRQLNEILANKQPLGRPGGPKQSFNRSQTLDPEPAVGRKSEKDSKKDKKKLRDDEKLEKRRLKEEEKVRRQEKKLAAKKSKSGLSSSSGSVGDDGVPLFIRRCIEFIESEGLDAEGIYRVPGNRAHVDAFVQKFKENPDMSILESDIPVNAVATALKDFLSKKWGPIIPMDLMNELTELSSISDREQRVEAVRNLINKLPPNNYGLLRFVFSHFVKVSLNHSLNSMDSKNLAICWWPTLLPLHFNDMVMFEQMRPHLEESIQTMIDQYDYIFDNEEPTSSTKLSH